MMIFGQPILFYFMLFTIEKTMMRSVCIDNFVMNETGLFSTHFILFCVVYG